MFFIQKYNLQIGIVTIQAYMRLVWVEIFAKDGWQVLITSVQSASLLHPPLFTGKTDQSQTPHRWYLKGFETMQLIYIHGLNSNSNSVKGKMLDDWCQANRPEIRVLRPDLNMPPQQVMATLQALISQDAHSGLVGSSLGGFYATACVAQFGVRAVLVNPVIRPFERFNRFFAAGQTEHLTETGWVIRPEQMDDLKALYRPLPAYPEKMLVLLKQGDEVLDYRDAENHYSQDTAQSAMIVEPGGDHFMHDMDTKIPLIMNFLFDR